MTTLFRSIAVATLLSLSLAAQSSAELLLSPADQIIGGILNETDFVEGLAGTAGGVNNWPGAEPPEELIDGFYGGGGAKYLNFFELNTGVIITPVAGATVVTSMTLWTANDAVDRDPATYELYGSNATIFKGGPGTTYAKSDFTLISAGDVTLPADRNGTATPIGDAPFSSGFLQTIPIANSASYTSYMLIFPTVKNAAGANSMQVSEAAFEGTVGTGTKLEITQIVCDRATDMVTVTWRSQPETRYILFYSPDMSEWAVDVADDISGTLDSDFTTFGPFLNPTAARPDGFFRVDLAP